MSAQTKKALGAQSATEDVSTGASAPDVASHAAHTPGPWRWFVSDSIDTSQPHIKTIVGANGQGFALTVGLYMQEDAANAHLIAAAPDLLAALKAVIANHCPNDRVFCGSCSAARDIIAKAEGRSPETQG